MINHIFCLMPILIFWCRLMDVNGIATNQCNFTKWWLLLIMVHFVLKRWPYVTVFRLSSYLGSPLGSWILEGLYVMPGTPLDHPWRATNGSFWQSFAGLCVHLLGFRDSCQNLGIHSQQLAHEVSLGQVLRPAGPFSMNDFLMNTLPECSWGP